MKVNKQSKVRQLRRLYQGNADINPGDDSQGKSIVIGCIISLIFLAFYGVYILNILSDELIKRGYL